jgi:hypothetical protein
VATPHAEIMKVSHVNHRAWESSNRKHSRQKQLVGALLLIACAFSIAALFVSDDDADATTKTSASFYSPSGNISCEMDDHRHGVPSQVACQSIAHAHTATLSPNGHTKICRGQRCLGNIGENTPILGYGKQIRLGRFRCRSEQNGITCNVIATGDGFLIDRTTVLVL